MTYYEKYKALADRDEIMEQAKSDAKVALFLGGNPDRLKAIEDAMNKALDEASVGTERGEEDDNL